MIQVGVIGYGYWGPIMVRNLVEVPEVKLSIVSDIDAARRELVERRYPGVRTTADYRDILNDPSIDAVAVITAAATHYDIAMAALQAGKHVWVEKPLTETGDQGARLVDEAAKQNRILFVDHTFIYTGAVRKMREIVESGRIGNPQYYDSMRTNLGLYRPDVNVLWDLAVHDLAIMDYVLGQHPSAVSATAIGHVPGMPEDVGYMTCFYQSDLIAHINVSWITPTKVRQTFVGGDKQMILYDDNEPQEKIRVYDRGVRLADGEGEKKRVAGYRNADIWTPALDGAEALKVAETAFARAIQTGQKPITDGEFGLRVVRIMEAAIASAAKRGAYVEIARG
jgi:predicted dehydrogenase